MKIMNIQYLSEQTQAKVNTTQWTDCIFPACEFKPHHWLPIVFQLGTYVQPVYNPPKPVSK